MTFRQPQFVIVLCFIFFPEERQPEQENALRTRLVDAVKLKIDVLTPAAAESPNVVEIEVTKEPAPRFFRARITCAVCSDVISYTKGNRAWIASNFVSHLIARHSKEGSSTKKRKQSTEQEKGAQTTLELMFKKPTLSKNHDGTNPSTSKQLTGNGHFANL